MLEPILTYQNFPTPFFSLDLHQFLGGVSPGIPIGKPEAYEGVRRNHFPFLSQASQMHPTLLDTAYVILVLLHPC